MNTSYRIEDHTAILDTPVYISRFRDAQRIEGYCRMCGNYGKSWACPPFAYDVEGLMRGYRRVFLVATCIIPEEKGLPFSEMDRFLLPERLSQEELLRRMETPHDGRAFAYAGTCLYCKGIDCARKAGMPCRHPELVRSSLEAAGFDIGRTVSELFHFELEWGSGNTLPDYLTLVGGLFYNGKDITWKR